MRVERQSCNLPFAVFRSKASDTITISKTAFKVTVSCVEFERK
jgi:hypothetical protein